MATGRLKVWNARVGAWDYVSPGELGATGPTGPEGPIGPTGPQGSYTEISSAEITAGTSSSSRTISGRRAQEIVDKAKQDRVISTATGSSLTPDASNDLYEYTALASNLTIGAPVNPVDGSKLMFRFKDNGSSRLLNWNAIFRAIGVTIATATTPGKVLYVGCVYNAGAVKWDVIAKIEEA